MAGKNSKKEPMTKDAAARVQSNADRNPQGKTGQDGFKERAQRAAAKNEN